MAATVAKALHRRGQAYLARHAVSVPRTKAWGAIVACRTAALDEQLLA